MLTPIPTVFIISLGVPHALMLSTLQILIFIFHSSTKPNLVSSHQIPIPFHPIINFISFFQTNALNFNHLKNEFTHSFFHQKKFPPFQSIIPVIFLIPICVCAWLFVGTTHEKKNYAWSPLVCTTLKNFWGSLKKMECACVETIFNGCNCVPDDLPYHSHAEGGMLCLYFFQNLVLSLNINKKPNNRQKRTKTHK